MEQEIKYYNYASLKPGEIIEGRYRILHPITLKAMVRDLKDGWKEEKSFPLQKHPDHPHPTPQESQYCEILKINERNGIVSATLSMEDADGDKGSWRRFPLSSEEDIELIKDSLKKHDHEVFCTVVRILGKEVLGDIKCLPKDPPILKLPEEVFCMICDHYLDREDVASLRLVCHTFAHEFLPIHKLWPILSLTISADVVDTSLANKKGPEIMHGWGTRGKFTRLRRFVDRDLNPIPQPLTEVNTNWLNTTKELTLFISLLVHCPDYWDVIVNNCAKLEVFQLMEYSNSGEIQAILLDDEKMNSIYSHVLSKIQGTLKKFEVYLRQGNFDTTVLTPCKNLKEIDIFLRFQGSLVNLTSLLTFKNTLTSLRLAGITNHIKKDELMWIVRNFKNLESLKVRVIHFCDRKEMKDGLYYHDEGEIDEHVLLSILSSPSYLKTLELLFGRCDEEEILQEDGRTMKRSCPEADRIVKAFEVMYKDQGDEWTCAYAQEDFPVNGQSIIRCMKDE